MHVTSEKQTFLEIFKLPVLFVLLLWVIHLIQFVTGTQWGYLGVYPRTWGGLKGVLFAPLIHGDFIHLMSNSVPMLMLGSILMYFYRRVAVRSFIMIYFLSGLVVWALARSVFHIGASGVVYGLVAFVFWNGIFRRSLRSIILALVVTVLYSGYFAGILPNQEGISWESHLVGGLVGIFTAYFFKEELELEEEQEKAYQPFADEPDRQDRPYFFDKNVFDKTKAERLREQSSDWTSDNTWQ